MKADIAESNEQKHDQPQTAHSDRPSSTDHTNTDLGWQALVDSQISMPLHKLLHLLPRFKETVHSLTNRDPLHPSVNLTAPTQGTPLMDSQNPVVQLIIRGHKVPGCIIDGRSGVNVSSEVTCNKIDITQWESCPFWLRMADTRSICPIGFIQNFEFTLGGHAFTVSIVILHLEAPDAYPLLLGCPWLRTANIKQHW